MVGGESQLFSQIIERDELLLLFPDKQGSKFWNKLKFRRSHITKMKGTEVVRSPLGGASRAGECTVSGSAPCLYSPHLNLPFLK
jgi:hypothetical protein